VNHFAVSSSSERVTVVNTAYSTKKTTFCLSRLIIIISEKHRGETIERNLCLSCPNCNGYKGSNIGSIDLETQLLTSLFNPRQHLWAEHFRLNGAIIEPLTPEGRVTVFILRLNKPEIVEEREGLIFLGRYPCGRN
jgi:hypothetical protein